ncbi:extracellular exo-alpha-(1-_5)-L-arabinofuranosidase [Abditibacteriota bacterium]|nr:extracellular exo-alpha-(1->5)-L-arabinofuranosidase [Abditibacteriota bacterium]
MKFAKILALCGVMCALSIESAPMAGAQALADTPRASRTFTNPVLASGNDPWVTRHDGYYYYCGSAGGQIFVGKSRELLGIGSYTKGVFVPPQGQPYSRDLWAPEIQFLEGKWFIYVAADDGKNENHRMYVLRAKTDDAQGEYEVMGALDTGGRWAIDGDIFSWQNKLYFIWSGWEGTENVAQNLYIAPMSNPWTISGPRVLISKPELPWELNGRPHINEGPTALIHENRLFIVYSASGSWSDDYCLGRLDFTGGDVLNPQNWKKFPRAAFARTDKVFGPGHASFVNDGTRDWIVYHSARRSGSGWTRTVRMQPFTWNADGSPDFGVPLPSGVPILY